MIVSCQVITAFRVSLVPARITSRNHSAAAQNLAHVHSVEMHWPTERDRLEWFVLRLPVDMIHPGVGPNRNAKQRRRRSVHSLSSTKGFRVPCPFDDPFLPNEQSELPTTSLPSFSTVAFVYSRLLAQSN